MECKQCGSSEEVYIFKDCCDCDCLCKGCLLDSCDIEEVSVKRYVDVNSRDVFYSDEELVEHVVDAGLVEIESEKTTVFYDSDTAEYLEDDEDLINYLEEKYDATITDADICPECGAVLQQLYLVVDESGDFRTVMCEECILETIQDEVESEDKLSNELRWFLEEKLKISIIKL